MRYIFFFSFLLTTPLLFGQQASGQWCGTAHNGADYEQQIARLLASKAIAEAGIVGPRNTRYIPIKFHLSAKDDGSRRISENLVLDQFCELNEDFAPYDMQFYLADGSFNYIDDTDLFENHLAVQSSVMDPIRDTRAVNVFIVDNADAIDDPEDQGTTLAYYNIPRDWIVITATQIRANSFPLTHELGHYFSLLHTFNGFEAAPHDTPGVNAPVFSTNRNGPRTEFADGSNCSNAGDFICDTPADYNNGLGTFSCRMTANILDPNGNPIDPDELNFLGYFLRCDNEDYYFSDLQVSIMQANYAGNSRRSLRLDPVPDVVPLGATPTAVYPLPSGSSAFYDQIAFEWTASPGATSYLFQLSRFSNFQNTQILQVVDDNQFTLNGGNLLAGRRYYWRVRPFNAHFACSDEPVNRNQFTTSTVSVNDPTAVAELKALSAFNVAPNPVVGTDDLILRLQAREPFRAQLQLVNLNGQIVQAAREFTLQSGAQQISIPVSDLPNGIYFLRLLSDAGQATQKVIIAR